MGHVRSALQLAHVERAFKLSLYPVDLSLALSLPPRTPDATEAPHRRERNECHPIKIVRYALACWNRYLVTGEEGHLQVFLIHARWLVEHEMHIGDNAGGWPTSIPHEQFHTRGSWLSALTQGCGISVLMRAYQLTHEEVFLEVAQRAVRTFERDILDGGVSTPVGENGLFFEEVAVYPAAHLLIGFIFGLLGLYDYVLLSGDVSIEKLIHRGLSTMHQCLEEFDTGYWTRASLHPLRLASPSQLLLQAGLLNALAKYSGCNHCSRLAARWKSYRHRIGSRLRYLVYRRLSSAGIALQRSIGAMLFPGLQTPRRLRICVTVPAFNVAGGVQTVLENIARVTTDIWELEYAAHFAGPDSRGSVIYRFGTPKMGSWQFPVVWLYVLAGCRKLISLMYHGANYQVLMPQDAIHTAAFTVLAARLAGVRVVCIDHGHLGLLQSPLWRAERYKELATRKWTRRYLARFLYLWYWPSLHLLALFAARFVDLYLVPGAPGDGVEEVCRYLRVPPSRIMRFKNMIEIDRHIIPDAASRAAQRAHNGIGADAIVVAIICRLAPEKGLEIALEAIQRALSALPDEQRIRLRVIIAGDGPLRKQLEDEMNKRGLSQVCALWGEASAQEVVSILGMSDIFMYTSWRGAGYPLAILEAMASGCAVIASSEPLANERMLDEGRGIVVSVGDVEQTALALVRLVSDLEGCHRMGKLARDYIKVEHSPAVLRRSLVRATSWSGLDWLLADEHKTRTPGVEGEQNL